VVQVLRAHDLLREVRGEEDLDVLGVSHDSRAVAAGDLFVAWKGLASDGHDFVADACRSGAVAAVVERPVEVDVTQLVVRDGRLAASLLAYQLAGSPGEGLVLVAVTGTNGKTTTALILRHVLGELGPATAIGTLGVVDGHGRVWAGTEALTTPGPVQLASWLADLVEAGAHSVTLEASSHALDQRRLDALRFDAGVFTNFGHDHLDYHGNLDAYREAKGRLLELLGPSGTAVINADEPAWSFLPEGAERLTYGIESSNADVRAENLIAGPEGSSFSLLHRDARADVRLPLLGRFNVENALAATAAALALGLPLAQIAGRLSSVGQVPGRLELVVDEPTPVLIDFAHTPGALETVLSTLRPLVSGRLVVVFGAGGDRDRGKRRPMAEAVARHADVIVATSDNPRTENPERILDDLEDGLVGVTHERIADRREAICRALELAQPDDLVLLAGKGHETYQVVGAERRPFDERVIVRECLAQMGAT